MLMVNRVKLVPMEQQEHRGLLVKMVSKVKLVNRVYKEQRVQMELGVRRVIQV